MTGISCPDILAWKSPARCPARRLCRSDAGIWRDRFVSEYTFREKITHEVVDETIFLNFVELNRFDKSLDDCVDLADKWFYSLMALISELTGLPEDDIRKL